MHSCLQRSLDQQNTSAAMKDRQTIEMGTSNLLIQIPSTFNYASIPQPL